jgi:hypothetical protein
MQKLCGKEGMPALKGMATLKLQPFEQQLAPCFFTSKFDIRYSSVRYSKIKSHHHVLCATRHALCALLFYFKIQCSAVRYSKIKKRKRNIEYPTPNLEC